MYQDIDNDGEFPSVTRYQSASPHIKDTLPQFLPSTMLMFWNAFYNRSRYYKNALMTVICLQSAYVYKTVSYRFTHDSIMSLDISFSRVSRCLPNSSSGQCRSLMKVCRASSFQKRSSDVPEPLLQGHRQNVTHMHFYFNLLEGVVIV